MKISQLPDPISPILSNSELETSSSTLSSPLFLPSDTITLLDSFYADLAISNQKLKDLADQANSKLVDLSEKDVVKTEKLSVDEFRALFGEDWQLSQFWYSTKFANDLVDHIVSILEPQARVVFLCAPTAFVAFNHRVENLNNAMLFEFDKRFELIAGDNFVNHDLDEPEVFPEELRGKFDLAICDPPFLNKITNEKLSITLRALLRPTGQLILITSTSVRELPDIYTERPLGPLREIEGLIVDHSGGLANDFKAWSS